MSQNVFANILAEEDKASALMLDAQQSANEMVKNAEAQAAEVERRAAVENRTRFQQLLDERRNAVEGRLAREGEGRRAALEEQLSLAGRHLPQAVSYIIDEVTHGAG